jgi:hypothetical protein
LFHELLRTPIRNRVIPTVTLAILAVAGLRPGPATAASGAPARLVASAGDRVVFQVDVPAAEFSASSLSGFERIRVAGFGNVGNPAEPPVPTRTFLVAIPPEARYSVTARVIASESYGRRRLEPCPTTVAIPDEDMGPVPGESIVMDETVYRAWSQVPLVEPQDPAFIRHQRALPVRVNPISYDPQSGELSMATRIEVTVQLSGAVPRVGAAVPGRPESKGWDDTFRRLFVNPGQTAAWRLPLPEASLAPRVARQVVPGAVKLQVRETAMHKVRASTVIAQGFPAGQPLGNLHLFKRNYTESSFSGGTEDVAFTVIEDAAGTPGVFDGNDVLVFYGRRLRDDANQGDTLEQFSAFNVYWLEPSAGTTMATRTPGVGFVTADTSTAAFSATRHFETDLVFRDPTPLGINDIYYYNLGFEAGPVDMSFPLTALKPGSNATLSSELHGQKYTTNLRYIKLSLVNSKGQKVLDGAYPIFQKTARTFSANLTAADFDTGNNRFRFERPDPGDPLRTTVEVLLNWVEVTGQFLYRARGNELRFHTAALTGDTTLTVTGITSSSGIELFDITSPLAPVRLNLGAGHFPAVPGGFALSFRENIPSRREFAMVPVSRMTEVVAADVVADRSSAIIGSAAESGVDVLVVSNAMFLSQMQQWVAYRRAQGYRVYMVDVEDVFDEFNGGVPSPVAVFRFTRHFFENGNAGTLVLVGDASEDHKRVHDDSGPDFVPTFTRIDAVSSLALDEVVTVDKRFVKMRGPGGTVDNYPDLVFGRIPVGNTGELDLVLAKTFKYESPTASDFWRKRMIIMADDTYSEGGSSFGGSQFCNAPGEIGFRNSQEATAQTIEGALPAGYDVERFYLADYTSAFYTSNCASQFAAMTYTRTNITDLFINQLSQGATLVTMQAHMNRSLVTHERLLATLSAAALGGSTGRDHLRVDNRGKPFIMFGMGCHFSEYASHREQGSIKVSENNPNGDAIAEQFLFQNDRGAVGAYGSSGFEYLGPNATYMETAVRIWFYEAPYDTMINQTRGEWIFGDLMFLVEAQMAGTQRDPVERYLILGDPLLRIDAGPPAFDVTLDGAPFGDGDIVTTGGEGDTIRVVATVTDENAIRDFKLEINGADESGLLSVTPLVDAALPRARQYRVSFQHKLRPENYDIVLRAFQAPDTLAGQYHMVAEFTLRVESSISVSVNGREIASGAPVPATGNYRVDMAFPVFIPQNAIQIAIDDDIVSDAVLTHPSPEDSLKWVATFRRTLPGGRHVMTITAGTIEFIYNLVVSEAAGLRNVINYPNPFRGEGTSIVYTNDVEILNGTIDIFTVSGKRVRRIDIPPQGRFPGQNAVFWDGRDAAGDELANGTYLYVIRIEQRVGSSTTRGKMARIQ